MAKIFCAPCAGGPDGWTHAYDLLKTLYAASEPRRHEWVDTPEAADIILLCNPQQANGDAAFSQPLRLAYPNKCFVLSEQWTPVPRFAGIYANAPRKALWRSRFRSASYALHHPDFKNPYVQEYQPGVSTPSAPPDLLFSFAGRNCHPTRQALFEMSFSRRDIVVRDTSQYDAFRHGEAQHKVEQREYFELCLRSKFILCPRGIGPNSVRLFEALHLGIAPIIVSDAWVPCEGPDWNRFALFVAEKDIGRIEEIASAHEDEYLKRGREARKAHEAFFGPSAYFNYLISSALSIKRSRLLPESALLRIEPVLDLWDRAVAKVSRASHGKIDPVRFSRHPFLRSPTNAPGGA